jgi:hypothetical protein
MESIESIKFFGVDEYAGGAQAMRPYLRISWGILGLANAKNLHFIKINIELQEVSAKSVASQFRSQMGCP